MLLETLVPMFLEPDGQVHELLYMLSLSSFVAPEVTQLIYVSCKIQVW